jgi:hypothetical protein
MLDLRRTFFIGGSPCAGKSTICNLLVQKHSFLAYHCDEHYDQHLANASTDQPTLQMLGGWSWSQAMTRPVDQMIASEWAANQELGALALEDVALLQAKADATAGVVAEGMALLPAVLANLRLTNKPLPQAVYLVPTEAFQLAHYAQREWAQALCAQTPDPAATFANWMARDAANARALAASAQSLGFPLLVVDGSLTIDETLAWCEHQLGL